MPLKAHEEYVLLGEFKIENMIKNLDQGHKLSDELIEQEIKKSEKEGRMESRASVTKRLLQEMCSN